jgi:hypothetical protein
MAANGPGGPRVLVGRDEVVRRARRIIDDAAAGRGSLTLVTGEAGAGKPPRAPARRCARA